MKLIDIKLPKKTKKELKEEAVVPSLDRDEYPWGMQLDFEKEQIKKLSSLQGIQIATTVNIQAVGKVTRVEVTDRERGRARHNVQIQVQKIAIAPKSEQKATSLGETVTTIAEARKM